MITEEIAGYTFNTERFCPECVRVWTRLALMNEGYWQTSDMDTEGLLNVLAGLWDIDREYADSNDFPVPFSGQTAESERDWSEYMGEPLPVCDGESCGNDFTGGF